MTSRVIDTHPHVVSDDIVRYPPSPLFGLRSGWSQERPCRVENLIEAMDAAGVDKAAVVHSSTTYGYNNQYVVDACARYPHRLLAVGSVDILQPDATQTIRQWVARGLGGLRLFTGGSTKAFDPRELDDERAYPAWQLCGELNLSLCITTGPVGLRSVLELAMRFPRVNIILDHLAAPSLSDGPPYVAASALLDLAPFTNIYLKLTPRTMRDCTEGKAAPETFFTQLVGAFGAPRIMWGSNYPASPGTLTELLETAKKRLSRLSAGDRDWIFRKTAQHLYPALTD